ncbi:hypothetical protein JX265_007334 [Neoarthrinium moseri]|uniref:Uncharacterized protein n=1 Tax=Neoarthrinium moseri TaxID=1658444 RepID=A0A9P9WKJ6_9PEZI|nr:hypothetical protein JX265_007334 [Neoarthrinium moseri]
MSESTPFKTNYDSEHEPSRYSLDELPRPRASLPKWETRDISLLISIIGNVLISFTVVILFLSRKTQHLSPDGHAQDTVNPLIPPGVEQEVLMPVTYGWAYHAETVEQMDEVDRNWNLINEDVGAVSMLHEDYARWGVSPSTVLDPSDPSKGIHMMRGYHSLHCLKVIRHTMQQLVKREPLDVRFGHSMHCLGSLLQDAICYADNSFPLRGEKNDGEFQYLRKYRNWAALSKWAGF